jgi:pyruvate kinase
MSTAQRRRALKSPGNPRSTLKKSAFAEILCTIGPASLNDYTLTRLAELGAKLFRINLSHTKLQDLPAVIRFIQRTTSVPICLDTEGAQIRTGDLLKSDVFLPENALIRVYGHSLRTVPHDSLAINFYPQDFLEKIEVGDFLSIDFNSVLAQVVHKDPQGLTLRIITEGRVGKNKAVSILNRTIVLPPLTEKDRRALSLGARMGIRYVALSFASRGTDIDELLSLSSKGAFVISKIESLVGLSHLEEIAAKSNALLIDRGDLSREIPIEVIPQVQKYIIQQGKKAGVKVYVATNLLESMVKSPTPTRAEVNDIFTTLMDGADGLVLAAETAIGAYPVHCAMMVSKMIGQFHGFAKDFSLKNLKKSDSFLLVEPHGGTLVDRINENLDPLEAKKCTRLDVDQTALLNAEQIAIGTFSPLEGFMTKKEVDSVLRTYRLPNGVVWPLPIVLPVPKGVHAGLKRGEIVSLALAGTDDIYALLHIEDIYIYDLDKMAALAFGTNDPKHPGVQLLNKGGAYFLGGPIELLKRLPSPYKIYELTPREVRLIFENKNWSKVVGFHTRNVIHRAHEFIQMQALEKYHCDGLFVHPIVGPKKKEDYDAGIILESYQWMLEHCYPKGKVLLAAFQNYSRYSGPREAIFTALCRKNFGCSHFIVGRDHTGVENYYRPDDAQRLFERLGKDLGLVPIFFKEQHYCEICESYVETCKHGSRHILKISGTEGRRILTSGKTPPAWFMRPAISKLILNKLKAGKEVFVR